MRYLSTEELKQMFVLQEQLNKAYMGEDWKTKWKTGDIKAALLTEMGEFLMETERDWKIWKPNAKFDRDKALFEFIDVVHFMLMGLLYEYKEDLLIGASSLGESTQAGGLDHYSNLSTWFGKCLVGIDNYHQSLIDKMTALKATVEIGAIILYLSPGDIFEAYKKKHAVNMARAKGGADYDRSKEPELKLD